MNAPLPPGAAAIAMLPINNIAASPTNPRKHFDEAYLAELAESIKAHGLIQPITVRPNPLDTGGLWPYEIVVGECRWRAAKIAGLKEIPGFWRELDDKQVLEIQVIENLQRRDVHAIEEAEGFDQLIRHHGYTADSLGEKIGKSRSYVYGRLKLLALSPPAREACFEGKMEASTALLVARVPASLQQKALKLVTNGYGGEPLSYRTAKGALESNFTISLKQATFRLDAADLVPAAGSCTACPKRAGNDLVLQADGIDADVCTDTPCFEEKKLARRAQLIAHAEKKKIPVITGDEAWKVYHDDARVDLDDTVEGDGQERTYREILGDQAPKPTALVEIGHGSRQRLVELADATAMDNALKKAGWTPDLFKEGTDPEEKKKRQQEEAERQAKREAQKAAKDAEDARRAELRTGLAKRIHQGPVLSVIDHDRLVVALTQAWLRQETEYSGLPDTLLKEWSIDVPEESDTDERLDLACAILATWPAQKALAFLFTALTAFEEHPPFDFDPATDQPWAMMATAAAIGFNVDALREPASTPSQAAQAQGKGSPRPDVKYALLGSDGTWNSWDGKGQKPRWVKDWLDNGGTLDALTEKTDPAPAAPANETPIGARIPWPFPTGNRPATTQEAAQ